MESTHNSNILIHNSDVIGAGLFTWFLVIIGQILPNSPMINFILFAFNITDILPYLQAGVYLLVMLVSIFTLAKLSMEMKLYSKFKKWRDKK